MFPSHTPFKSFQNSFLCSISHSSCSQDPHPTIQFSISTNNFLFCLSKFSFPLLPSCSLYALFPSTTFLTQSTHHAVLFRPLPHLFTPNISTHAGFFLKHHTHLLYPFIPNHTCLVFSTPLSRTYIFTYSCNFSTS